MKNSLKINRIFQCRWNSTEFASNWMMKSILERKLGFALINSLYDNSLAQLIILSAGLASVLFFIAETYSVIPWVAILVFESCFFGIFLIDYVVCVTAASNKLDFMTSFEGISSLLSLVPVIDIILPSTMIYFQVGFLHCFRLINIFHIIPIFVNLLLLDLLRRIFYN